MCGFKAFRKAAAMKVSAQSIKGFASDGEILMLARRENLKVVSRPVVWTDFDDSKVRLVATVSEWHMIFCCSELNFFLYRR